MVENLHHFLFECKTLRGIRQEQFEEMETVIKSFYPLKQKLYTMYHIILIELNYM
jgi:hypothetical protein